MKIILLTIALVGGWVQLPRAEPEIHLIPKGIALAGLPGVLQVVGVSVWYAEGSRQAQFMATMETWWETFVNSGLALLVGGITVASAAKIASVLDARYAGGSAAGEPAR